MTSNILVTGASGKTGRKVVKGLIHRNQNVRLGSRKNDPPFDWEDPSTWPAALDGMDKVYIVYYTDLAVPGAFEAIAGFMEASKEAGIKKAVLLSGKGEKEAERCEALVANSGLEYVLVRASWFNQNFSESFLMDPILAGYVALPMPEAEIPFVDTDDIAGVVVEALLDEKHNGRTYEVTGPRKLTFHEVVQEISKATGRNINYQAVMMDGYNGMMKAAGLPADYVWLFDYLFREVLGNPDNHAISSDVKKVLGREATDFSDYVRKTAATGVWNQAIPQTI